MPTDLAGLLIDGTDRPVRPEGAIDVEPAAIVQVVNGREPVARGGMVR
jgi:hypothetical protein